MSSASSIDGPQARSSRRRDGSRTGRPRTRSRNAAAPARSAPAARRCARPACRSPSGPASGSTPDRPRGTAASADRAAAARPQPPQSASGRTRKTVLRREPELVIAAELSTIHPMPAPCRAPPPRPRPTRTPRSPARLNAAANETEQLLDRLLAAAPAEDEIARPHRIIEAMRYTSLGGGKRLRPFLTVETAALFGVKREQALMAGAAIELRALLFAGARRPAGDGRRRSAPRPADRAQEIRRGDRDPRRRRAADLRLRRAGAGRRPIPMPRCGSRW